MSDRLWGADTDDRFSTADPAINVIVGNGGNDFLDLSLRGGAAYGGSGNDTLLGGGAGTRQSHMYGGDGDDVIHMGTGTEQAPYGDHAWGGQGSDEFHFTTSADDRRRITGRIDDFDASRDRIFVNGLLVDLADPPDNVRIVLHADQPWILIDGRILYALEGARQVVGGPGHEHDGTPHASGAEEKHFIDWPEAWAWNVPRSADIPYEDFHDYFPAHEYFGPVPEDQLPTQPYTPGNDRIHGSSEADQLLGGDGADTIHGWGGNDIIHGGEHGDLIYGGAGNDSISGGLDDDLIHGDLGDDVIHGGSGQDTIYGGLGSDRINGNNGNDLLHGDSGNDTIHGGLGDDVLHGGQGQDQLFGGAGSDSLHGGPDGDLLDGGAGNDLLEGDAGHDTLLGGTGDDILKGGLGDDRLDGGAGNDLLEGDAGNDTLLGDAGHDTLKGGLGDDQLDGGAGNDLLEGDEGNDTLLGGAGNDTLLGGSGHDLIFGGDGADVVQGDAGNDTLIGGAGSDSLYGGAGHDLLHAGTPDEAAGRGLSALMVGGDGNDTFHADPHGMATILGGEGRDLILAKEGARIVIGDFNPLEDILDLGGMFRRLSEADSYLTQQGSAGQRWMQLDLDRGGRVIFEDHGEDDRQSILRAIRNWQAEEEKHKEEQPETEDDDRQDPVTASGGGCFVATACYGGRAHPDVAWLRRFRDRVLVRHAAGRLFVRLYWIIGPRLARHVDCHGRSGRVLRRVLGAVVAQGRHRWPHIC